jgi:gluconate 2-dehydrogenase gamma chain
MKRRRFFLVASGVLAGSACAGRRAPPWRALLPKEVATLEAWCDSLVPDTDGTPGAREARAARYIDIQLTRRFRRHLPQYRNALEAINRMAGGRFSELSLEQRTALLEQVEKGEGAKSDWGPDGGREVFNLVLQHTLQGFYGNPRHGGNYEYASWRMLSIPIVPVRGRGVAYGA